MRWRTLKIAVGLVAFSSVAGAQNLTSVGAIPNVGGGLGSVLTVLTLQNAGGTSTGCVTPTGTDGCGFANSTVQQQSQTRLLSEIGTGSGDLGTDLRIIGNFSEPGSNSATVNSFVLTLYNGNTSLGSWSLTGTPVTFDNTNPGVGNAGFGFALDATGAAAFNALVTANQASFASLSVGLGASLSDVEGGLDTFFVARVNSDFNTVVPEPSTYALMAAGLLALGAVRRRRVTR